jgi:hypothetical protein
MRRLALLALAGSLSAGTAQGAELFFTFNRNQLGGAATASLFLFGDAGQQATVSNLAGFFQTVTLGVDGFLNLPIANGFQQSGTGIRNTGFSVTSDDPIAGYFINRAAQTTDMTYLLDSSALGTSYRVASFGSNIGEGSQVAVYATQNNTSVTITLPSVAPISVILNQGQTYKIAGGALDLTGGLVQASNPVAVFSGHECANVPSNQGFCDNLVEQMIPVNRLSNNYLLTASQSAAVAGTASDLVRVIATEANTQVNVPGVGNTTLQAGQFFEFPLPANTGVEVDATAPVMVAQYLKGQSGGTGPTDPAMSLVPGSDTWLQEYRLATPSGGQNFEVDYASLVVETGDIGTLMLDDAPASPTNCAAISGTEYSRCDVALPDGLFTLTAASPFLVMLGGRSSFDSYFTYGGATFAPGISPPEPPPTATPEPATLALFGTGMLGLAALRRRRR